MTPPIPDEAVREHAAHLIEFHGREPEDQTIEDRLTGSNHSVHVDPTVVARVRDAIDTATVTVTWDDPTGSLEDACAHCPGTCTHLGCGADGVRRRVLEEVDGVLRNHQRFQDWLAMDHARRPGVLVRTRDRIADYLRDQLGEQEAPVAVDPWPDAPLGDAGSIKGGEAEMVELTSPRYIPSGEELLRAAAEIDGERPAGSGAVVGTGGAVGAVEAISAGEEGSL